MHKKYSLYWLKTAGVVLVLALVYGCAGLTVREKDRIALPQDQVYRGTAGDFDYTFAYELTPENSSQNGQKTLLVSGTVSRNRPLETLIVRLNFLDAGGRKIESQTVYSSTAKKWRDGSRYHARTNLVKESFVVPPGTEAISFSAVAKEKRNIGGR